MIKQIILPSLLCLSLAHSSVVVSAQQLPALGNSASSYVSLQQEHDLGRLWLRQLRSQANVIDDPLAVQFLEDIIFRLVPHSEVQISDFEFVVIDQSELNAFAVPGGIIGINYGIFLYTQDEDELSGVLGHELAHLSQRHFARQLEEADKQSPVAIATLLASILLIATSNADLGFAGLLGSQAASIQRQLAYSRSWEREADRLGIKILADSGLDPTAMSSMFQQMLQASRFNQRPPEFLLTHPITEGRVAEAADRAESYSKKPRTAGFEFWVLKNRVLLYYQLQGQERDLYLQRQLEKTANQAIAHAATLYALAELALQQNKPDEAQQWLKQIAPEKQKEIAVIALQAKVLQALNQPSAALKLIDDNLPFAPKNYILLSTKASLLALQNQWSEAILQWRLLSELRPTEPYIWKELSQAAAKGNQLAAAYKANAEFLFYNGQYPQALRQMDLAIKEAKKINDFQMEAAFKQRQLLMANAPTRF